MTTSHDADSPTLWRIARRFDGKFVSVAGFFTKDRAERQIREWQERQAKGGRPDVDAFDLVAVPDE